MKRNLFTAHVFRHGQNHETIKAYKQLDEGKCLCRVGLDLGSVPFDINHLHFQDGSPS